MGLDSWGGGGTPGEGTRAAARPHQPDCRISITACRISACCVTTVTPRLDRVRTGRLQSPPCARHGQLSGCSASPCCSPARRRRSRARSSCAGTAYEFNRVEQRLAGATIRVAERPALSTTTRSDGSYRLAVPDRARITPYIEAPGYRTIHLQTFRTAGEDLADVNFQTPDRGGRAGARRRCSACPSTRRAARATA